MRQSSRHVQEFTAASDLPLFELRDTPTRGFKRVAETSAQTYKAIGPALPAKRQKVYDALQQQAQPVTGYELFMWMKNRNLVRDLNDVRPRISELFDDGRILRGEKRACAITGHKSFTWSAR